MTTTTAAILGAAKVVSEVADQTIDIYTKLRKSFKLSDETIKQSEECKKDMKKLTFKQFDEAYSRKTLKEIPMDEFESFVTDRLQKRLNLPNNVRDSILDGLYVGENEENLNDFQFKDGKGKIHHGRCITMKRNGKMDIAYAIYSLTFELPEQESKEWCLEWFGVVPYSWNYKKEAHSLSESEKNKFSNWCEVRLFNRVNQECLNE